MHGLVTSGHSFRYFPRALYTTDVTFQQANRPSGSMAEAMPFFSAKHKLYSYKVEVSATPRGLAANCTRHARGNTADITMFKDNEGFHHTARVKGEANRRIPDNRPMGADYADEWAVLADKGYQGMRIAACAETFPRKRLFYPPPTFIGYQHAGVTGLPVERRSQHCQLRGGLDYTVRSSDTAAISYSAATDYTVFLGNTANSIFSDYTVRADHTVAYSQKICARYTAFGSLRATWCSATQPVLSWRCAYLQERTAHCQPGASR
ncbi:hypothetical protein JG688_00011131 [Phytophthora aleatoria]|uniref:DDE Tnp4 domain-containing protein n=1 Tax=Phytophthora aleatoria TaxID=2496075 RepID=A0A8J5INB5_9STRA|nr:hypothetical protein JG688_00011131 [Phytophthora aleatoria]